MAVGTMYKYSDFYCTEPCEHTDCKSALVWRQTPCKYCDKPVETGENYYTDEDNSPYHAFPQDCDGLEWSKDGMKVLPKQ